MSIATDVAEPATAPGPVCSPVEQALVDIAAGRMVVVVDDVGREEHGVLVLPAFAASGAAVGYLARHTNGLLVAPMTKPDLERLCLTPMVVQRDPESPAYTVPVDTVLASGTGRSATDRASTLQALADPHTTPGQLRRPGHLQPVRAAEHGVLERANHAEAALDLTRAAGIPAVSAVAELTSTDGCVLSAAAAARFATDHGLTSVSIAELITYRQRHERQIERVTEARLPTTHGEFRAVGYRHVPDATEHVALIHGDIQSMEHPLVHIHQECPTGDPFRSLHCDCRSRLEAAMAATVAEGRGLIVYLRGADSCDDLPRPRRDEVIVTQILTDLGVRPNRSSPPKPTTGVHR